MHSIFFYHQANAPVIPVREVALGIFLGELRISGGDPPHPDEEKKRPDKTFYFVQRFPGLGLNTCNLTITKTKKKTTQKKSRAGVSKNCFRIRNTDPLPLHFARRLSGDHPILFAGSLPVLPPPYTPSLASTAFLSLGGPHPRNKKDCTRPFGCGQGVVAGVKAISQEKKL